MVEMAPRSHKRAGRPQCHFCDCGEHAWAPLTKGYVTLVSPQDAPLLRTGHWSAAVRQRSVYAVRVVGKRAILLHRAVLGLIGKPDLVDHRNHKGTDNRRPNIRPCTHEQNLGNTRLQRRSESGFKGVYWHLGAEKWMARCGAQYIGVFGDPVEAARAYNAFARIKFGEFAKLNEVPDDTIDDNEPGLLCR